MGICGYYADSDKYQHVIAATSDGNLHEIYWSGGAGVSQDVLATLPGIVGICGYYADSDKYQHVIAATSDGNLHEIYWSGGAGVSQDVLATLPGIVSICGYYSFSDGYQHVIAATSDGNLHDIYRVGGGSGLAQEVRVTIPGVISMAGYFADVDNYHHIIVATTDGNVHEVYRMSDGPVGQDTLSSLAGVVGVAGYYAPSDKYQHVIAATADTIHELYFTGAVSKVPNIHQICQQITGMNSPLVIPVTPSDDILLGTYDARVRAFTWGPGFRVITKIIPPDPNDPGRLKPTRITEHHLGKGLIGSVSVQLVNNGTGLGLQANQTTSVVPPGVSRATVRGPFSGSVGFEFHQEGQVIAGDTLLLDVEHGGATAEAACVVVPALPVAVIYQPPISGANGTLLTDDTTGISLTKITSDAMPTTEATSASALIGTIGDFVSAVGGVIAGATDVGEEDVSGTLTAIGASLTAIKDVIPGPGLWGFEVTDSQTTEVTASVGQSWSSSAELGPGNGDLILYLRNVYFAAVRLAREDPTTGTEVTHTMVTPLGFEGTGPLDVLASRLKPGAADPPPDLTPDMRNYLLTFDPVASGNAQAVGQSSRYSFVQRFVEMNPGVKRTLSWSYTINTTAIEELHSIPDSDTGLSGGFASKYSRQGRTVTTELEATGPFSFDVYYDSLFGTFAFRTA